MTHFGVVLHSSLTGDPNQIFGSGAEPTALETFLTSGIFTLQSSVPKVTTDLFNKFTTSLSSIFMGATVEREALGLASIDISQALSEQIAIREQQRARDNEALQNTQIHIEQINERLSRQVTELGQSITDISKGGFDPIKFFTDNPILGGIGIGGLAVGAIVLLLVLKR